MFGSELNHKGPASNEKPVRVTWQHFTVTSYHEEFDAIINQFDLSEEWS